MAELRVGEYFDLDEKGSQIRPLSFFLKVDLVCESREGALIDSTDVEAS
jgi:hypothetical protein